MSSRRAGTSSKRKRTTPQKLKSRKLFAASRNDLIESPNNSRAKDGDDDSQQGLSQFPETLHNRENVPKSPPQTPSKNESLSETPQNKENRPDQYSSGSGTEQRGRGRPKGSKNKTFVRSANRVYSVREGKLPAASPKKDDSVNPENSVMTPNRGRGRPKGSVKVKTIGDVTPKKSRGRPKGSKNRRPSKGALKLSPSGTQKSGRGRPRKIVKSDVETPKRGRPKGSPNKVPSAKKLPPSPETHEIKKRGRPKKIHFHPTAELPLTPKRPRGRPKSTPDASPLEKNSQFDIEDDIEDKEDDGDGNDDEDRNDDGDRNDDEDNDSDE